MLDNYFVSVRAGRFAWLGSVCLVGLLLPATMTAAVQDVQGIDIIVKKKPTGHAFAVRTDGNGGFSVLVPEGGDYKIEVLGGAALNELAVGTPVRLTLDYRDKIEQMRARRVSGIARVNTSKLLALSQGIQLEGPAVVTGRLVLDQAITSVEHLTFTAVTGGPAPLERTFEIAAEGIAGYSYTVRSNDKLPVRVELSPAAGRAGARDGSPVIRVRPVNTALPVGVHQGLVEVAITPADGSPTLLQQISVTYDMRRSGDIDLVSDRRDYVLPALPSATRDGAPRLTTMILTLTNPDSVEQTFTMGYEKPGDQAMFRFPQPTFRIAAGGTVRVPVEVNRDAYLTTKGGRECVTVSKTKADGSIDTFTYYLLPADTTAGKPKASNFVTCTPSWLRPVFVRAPYRLTVGVPAEFEVEAMDDCGNPVTGFVAHLSLGKAGPREAMKAIAKGGQAGFFVVHPDPDQSGTQSDGVVEISKDGLYGTTRTKFSTRRNVPAAPEVSAVKAHWNGKDNVAGATVSAGDPIEVAVDLPGSAEGTADPGAPLPLELNGTRVLLNGEPIPVASVSATKVIAMIPRAPGRPLAAGSYALSVAKGDMITAAVRLSVADYTPRLLGAAKKLADGSLVPLSLDSRVATGEAIVLYATGLGDAEGEPAFALKQPVRGTIGGKEIKVTAVAYKKCPECAAFTVLAGRPLEELYIIEGQAPEGMLSHDVASGEVPITIQVGEVVSAALKGYGDASPLSTADFGTIIPSTDLDAPGPFAYFYTPHTEAVGSSYSFTTPMLIDAGHSRLERAGWFTSDPTGVNPPPDFFTDEYLLTVQALPDNAVPVYGTDYTMSRKLTAELSPAGCGTTIVSNPPSPDGFYPESTYVQLAATPAAGWTFSHWLGADAAGGVFLNAPQTVTGVCVQSPGLTLTTNLGTKPGLSVWFSSPAGFYGDPNGTVTGGAAAPANLNVLQGYLDGNVYWAFSQNSTPFLTWNGPIGNAYYAQLANPPASATTYTAIYSAACVVIKPSVSPASAGTLNISGTLYTQNGAPAGCFAIGSPVTITAVPATGQCLLNWGPPPAISSTANPLQFTVSATSVANPVANIGACPAAAVCLPPLTGTVGRYHFAEAASIITLADDSAPPAAPLTAVQTLQRAAGKVGDAVYFASTPASNPLLGTVTGAAATSTSSPAKYNFGTGAFSLDFWIKLDGSLANGRPMLQKMSGGSLNQIPSTPASGFRLRTVAGEFLQLTLADGTTTVNYTGTKPVAVNQWVHVAVTVPRTVAPRFYLDGVAETPAGLGFAGNLDNTAPLLVGNIAGPGTISGSLVSPVTTKFWLDELGLFNTVLPQGDIDKLVAAGSAGTCPGNGGGTTPQGTTVQLDTVPAGLNLTYGTIGSLTTQAALITIPITTPPTISPAILATAPSPQVKNGTQYTWVNWTGPGGATISAPGHQISTIGVGKTETYTANYQVSGYVVDVSGCNASAGPLSQATGTNPLVFPVGTTIQITASPAGGTAFQRFTVTRNGVTSDSTTNPLTLTVNGPITAVANCGASTTVNTSPANLGATVGVNGSTALNTYTTAATPATVSVTPTTITAGTTQYRFKNSWSFNGTPNPAWTSAAQTVGGATGVYTANFDTYYQVSATTTGGCTVRPAAGFYPAGSTQTVTVTAPTGLALSSISWNTAGGAQPLTNGGGFTVNSAGTLAVTCGLNPVITVNTNPAAIGATVGINTLGTALNQYSSAVPAGPHTLTANSPVDTPTIRYKFNNWRQGSTVLGTLLNAQPVTVSGVATYTAHYDVQAYKFTIVNNGCQAAGATTGLPADGYVNAGAAVSGFFATPFSGQVFKNVVLTAITSTGTFPGQPLTNIAGMTVTSGVATIITITCQAQ